MKKQVRVDLEDLEFTENEKEFVFHAIKGYKEQMKKLDAVSKEGATLALLESVDGINQEFFKKQEENNMQLPSCRRGCSHCCHIQVGTTKREVDLILTHMNKEGIRFSEEQMSRLQEQAKIDHMDSSGYVTSPHRQCVFLINNECSIYKVRPLACRNYYVYNDPSECNTYDENIEGHTLGYFNLDTMPHMVLLAEDSKLDSLSKYLMKYYK